jgi:uncharacterized protein (DUF2235 family)
MKMPDNAEISTQAATAAQAVPQRVLPDKIVVLSDGTGNSSAKVWRTNVWRTFELLDLTGSDQVAMYDDGVGTSSFLPLALLGGAFGWGLKRNVIDLYKFVCRNYPRNGDPRPAPKIYGFGFSRGAFTIRVLIGLILYQGLAPYYSEEDLHVRARSAYRAFRADKFHSVLRIETLFRAIRDAGLWLLDKIMRRPRPNRSENRDVEQIEFLGLWDTVAAYGLPIEEMTRGVSQWLWPLELPDRVLRKQIQKACHALSIDDERTTFHPVLWTERSFERVTEEQNGRRVEKIEERLERVARRDNNIRLIKDERVSQVWFAGVHANVGGGYPDDALAYVPLYWIMKQAYESGIKFKAPPLEPDAFRKTLSGGDKDGRKYNSRAGVAGYYRYGPRKIADLCNMPVSSRRGDIVEIETPKIHYTALQRLRSDSNAYAPIGLPKAYAVVDANGNISFPSNNIYETPDEAKARVLDQERVWNIVWLRRIVYFLTLAASFHLAAFWLFHNQIRSDEFDSSISLVSQFVRLVESFLPYQVVHWWTDYYATNPAWFVIGVLVLGVLIGFGSKLESKITDSMRFIWTQRATTATIESSGLHTAIRDFRMSPPYQAVLRALKYHILPFLLAIFLVHIGAVTLNHLALNIIDPTGAFCQGTDSEHWDKLEKKNQVSAKPIHFSTKNMCFATGVFLLHGARYEVDITPDGLPSEPWRDGDLQETSPQGFDSSAVFHDPGLPYWRRPIMYLAMPLRRIYFRRWFTVIARVGPVGMYEDYLDPGPDDQYGYSGTTNVVKRDGELFLYVNDAVIAVPGLFDHFYNNNHGTAVIRVRRM